MSEFDDLNNLIAELNKQKAELESKILELNAKKDEEAKMEHIRNTQVVIADIEVVGNLVYFRSNYREDFVKFLQTFPSRSWNGHKNSIEVTKWKDFVEQIATIPNVIINYKEGEEQAITDWKKEATFKVGMDDKSFIITPGLHANAYLVSNLPGIEAHYLKSRTIFRLPYAEAWKLVDKLKDVPDVEWTQEAEDYCAKQLELRSKLDEIAKKDKSEHSMILNGHALKDYQNIFLEFAKLAGFSLICADEMGLGKTAEAIAITVLMDEMYGNDTKYLFIVPASIRANWTYQLRKFLNAAPYEMFGREPTSVDMITLLKGDYKYYLCNYDMLAYSYEEKKEYKDEQGFMHSSVRVRRPWIDLINKCSFKAVFIDEAHKIKNLNASRTQSVREIQVDHRILLTGTPMLNRPGELWPLVNFINPKLLPSYDSFVRRYTFDNKTARNVDELREILKPIMIRRVKKDVMKELAPINRIERIYELSPSARNAYQKALDGFWLDFDQWDGTPSMTQVITSLLAQLMKLKQICAWDKVEYIADLASEIHENLQEAGDKNKVLVFTQFVNSPPVVHAIATRLANQGALEITGEIDPATRVNLVRVFQENQDNKFMVCSTLAAGEGLDITEAGAVVFNDLLWTPAAHHQAEGRAYGRVSDPHSIDSYYIISKDTIEEDISELLMAKMHMFNEIIEGAEASRDSSIAMELLKRLKERRFSR